ncbi:SDR family oxidoreductase [uncultured Piscinibacter sp.]|uniref:SDR family oxidoreductase n=1 Tax=uncultured Piscinibacter sp. TaxID=1131835 RepID=UPI0026261DED|nr:SDR family oxidoreductase [uncultured Piscinibacter sp.]
MTDLVGKNVLITGAASGIGRLMAIRIAARGARLILWDLDSSRLDGLRAELAAQGASVQAYVCDLARREAIHAAAERVLQECGPVDVLINNAGIVNGKWLLDSSDDEIERTFRVNTLALFSTTRAFLPGMLARGSGHVVNIASAAGLAGVPRLADYSASKFAVVGFDESLRLELGHRGSRVVTTIVCPYYIDTGMFRGARTRFAWLLPILAPDDVARRIVRAIETDCRRLLMPRFLLATLLVRALPPRAFDAVLAFFGITGSMDAFIGHGPH